MKKGVNRRWMRRLVRLISLLLTPTWKLRIRQQLHRAEMEYDAAVNAYHEAEGECRSSLHEHNQASYWKGRRDALRMFLPNAESIHPEPKPKDHEPKSN